MQRVYPPTSANVSIATAINATFQDAFQFGDDDDTTWNFSSKTFRMDVKADIEDPVAVLSFASADNEIIVDDVALRVLHFNVPMTTIDDVPPGPYLYDFIMTDADNVRTPLMHGRFWVTDGVTGA